MICFNGRRRSVLSHLKYQPTPSPSAYPYSEVGAGFCLDSQGARFNHKWGSTINGPEECANHCQTLGYLVHHTGITLDQNKYCYCEYTAGQGPVTWTGGNGVGPVAGATGSFDGYDPVCYRYGAFGVTDSPTGSPSSSPTTVSSFHAMWAQLCRFVANYSGSLLSR